MTTLADLIEEMVDLKLSGAPQSSEWSSIEDNARARQAYQERLEDLRAEINACVAEASST